MLVALLTLLAGAYFAIQNSWVQTQITNKIAARLSERLNTRISVGKVDIGFFHTLYLEDVLIEDQNRDTLLYSQIISAKLDSLKIRKQQISIETLSFKNNALNISRDSANYFNFSLLLNALGQANETDTLNLWKISCNEFDFGDLNISYRDEFSEKHTQLYADDLNLNISDFTSVSDSVSFTLNQLRLDAGRNLKLVNSSADVSIVRGDINITNFNLQSAGSEIKNTDLALKLYTEADSMNTPFDLNLRIGTSNISCSELGQLVPALKGMNQKIKLSGLIRGTLDDLKGKSLALSTGTNTKAILDFYVNDLMHPEEMYLFLDLKQSETSFTDISNIRLPNSAKRKYLEFPESFYNAGLVKFKGNFSGFLSDFVTFGTLESEMGSLTTDVLVTPEKEGEIYYSGNISTSNFELGEFFELENVGKLTFSGAADGNYNKIEKTVSGVFKGNVEEIDLNQYVYKNIRFDGLLQNKMFDGLLSVNDPNLKFAFLGELDLNSEIPRFDFDLNLRKALPSKLNLGEKFPDAEIAFKMFANFDGDRIDNLDGIIKVEEGYYKNRNGQMNLGGMELKTLAKDSINSLVFTSDFFDASIDGKYNFRTLLNDFEKIIHHFIPSHNYQAVENSVTNVFDYQVNCKEINRLAEIFVPGLELETPFLLYGKIDSPKDYFQFNGSIPGVKYKDFWARHIFIGNQNLANGKFASKLRVSQLLNRNGMKLYNFTIDSKVANNVLDNTISWSNFDELTYSGSLKTQTIFSRPDTAKHQRIEIKGLPSQIYIADTLWTISPYLASIDSSSFAINNFRMGHDGQEIAAEGKLVNGSGDLLHLNLKNIDLSYIDKYLNKDIQLEGIINGTFGIANAFDAPAILSNLSIENLAFKKQRMGNVTLISQWNRFQSTIDSELRLVRNNRMPLRIFGYMKPSTNELNYFAELDSVPLVILEAFMKKNFSDFHGTASGKVELGGTVKKIDFNGKALVQNAGLTVNATQIPYSLTDSIYLKNDTIKFDNITVYDDKQNTANFNGTIVHTNFNEMEFDLSFSSDKIRALNTTSHDNEQFYGTVIANGKLDITGADKATQLTGTATTLLGTDVKISMESESTVEQYDFIEFVSTAETKTDDFFAEIKKERNSELNMNFTIEATPEAKVQIVYNSQIGDVIKAQGEGILLFEMDNDGNMTLSGNYNPTKGNYLFTLQNVLNKRFSIKPGGSIIWTGDPYNAIIDLNAVYKLKASLYDILPNNFENKSQSQRIPVECILKLQDELLNPTIGFDINFPTLDQSKKDELSQFLKTEEEMNKQILSLIVMGKFYTPEYMRGTYEAQNTNMVGTTASELLSNQLSNWLSQISSNWDVGLNYRPGGVSEDEIEVALSTQIFNDRVSLNGNIGNNTNDFSINNSSSQIVGDFEIGVKLVPSGKIQFKAYNRSNNNLIYETAPYTQGIGLSFKEEYNSFDELLKKMTSIFKKKDK